MMKRSTFWAILFLIDMFFVLWLGSTGLWIVFRVWFVDNYPLTANLLLSAIGFLLVIIPYSIAVLLIRLYEKAQKEEEKKEK